jgi:hypothetical protein
MCSLNNYDRMHQMSQKVAILLRRVESRILVLRGRNVILDADLAKLYGVEVNG